MENVAFVLWLIGYPLANSIKRTYAKKNNCEYKPDNKKANSIVILIQACIYIWVATLVYN